MDEKKEKKEEPAQMDMESSEEKLPYPKSVFFIVVNEFCERFSYYGMKAVLTLYLTNRLNFSDDAATVTYHVFSMFAYFTPLMGAMIADSLLGKFRTIFYLSIVYAIGNVVLALAATPVLDAINVEISMLGLALIAIGTGGIKPCVAAFGGDQFILPQQAAQLVSFFSFFYMSINSGSLLSTFITPILRSDVQCFGDDSCYSLAFAVPAILMITALLAFLAGKFLSHYREVKPTGNVVIQLVKCIGHAISRKSKSKEKRDHWLDHADDEFDNRFIEDVKIVLRVLLLYLPLPVFWALFDQQGSRWTLQATRMDGVVGSYTIKPDQVQVLNPLLILLFIPLFDHALYPVLAKCHILTKPLQRLTTGGVLAGLAFIISGVLELELEKTYPNKLATNEANLNFINTLPCSIQLELNGDVANIEPHYSHVFEAVEAMKYNLHLEGEPGEGVGITMKFIEGCDGYSLNSSLTSFIPKKSKEEMEDEEDPEEADKGAGFTYMIVRNDENEVRLAYGDLSDDREKPKTGNPKLRFLLNGKPFDDHIRNGANLSLFVTGEGEDFQFKTNISENSPAYFTETTEVEPIEHTVKLVFVGYEDTPSTQVEFPQSFNFKLGASYIISITMNSSYTGDGYADTPTAYIATMYTITKESSLHMLWLLPQYIIITAGEIMFSITGLEFSYSQSPVSMKSVMQSAWLLTVALGNLIVVIIAEAKFFEEQSKEFFLFAGLMFVDMIWFAFMAWRYVPAQLEDPNEKKAED